MNSTISRLLQLISDGENFLNKASNQQLAAKSKPTKWSKKEILGHLIDSALYNLKRFTEIHFHPNPYIVIDYKQNELVKYNSYQDAECKNLIRLWVHLNNQIIHVIRQQDETSLKLQAILPNQGKTSLLFLINDYLEHLEHHMKQIIQE